MKKENIRPEEITQLLAKELEAIGEAESLTSEGIVLQVHDGIAQIYGLQEVQAGEVVLFESQHQGLVLNLSEEHVGVVILGDTANIKEGDRVKRTHKIATISVGEGMVGRVINTLGEPIDDKGVIEGALFEMPLERKAPGIIYREPVQEPLLTGIKAIDAMIPIGRGQRELIIGDRQIGKTTLAIDTIINQRTAFERGEPIYCIYVAIGQKASSISQVAAIFAENGAMEYTTIVAAPASDSAALQYLAPFAGTALGEFFRDTGAPALVVYDDLSKHANAYREISLLLRRPPGREAYPGDVFYLHARLLERAGKINATAAIAKQMNDIPPSLQGRIQPGGSLTALPIIETQAGDVSAYIPTNVISITDGQIFLESQLFYSDLRPAINVGISVSRVGGAAQTALMKKIAGALKLSQAQFIELEAFARFGSSLDEHTQKLIKRGKINQLLFTQAPYRPIALGLQIALLHIANEGYLDELPLESIKKFEKHFSLKLLKEHSEQLQALELGKLSDEIISILAQKAKMIAETYLPKE